MAAKDPSNNLYYSSFLSKPPSTVGVNTSTQISNRGSLFSSRNDIFSNVACVEDSLKPYPLFHSNRRRSSLQCSQQGIETVGITSNNYSTGSIEKMEKNYENYENYCFLEKNSFNLNRRGSDYLPLIFSDNRLTSEATFANFLEDIKERSSTNNRFFKNLKAHHFESNNSGIHRRSQPTLILYNNMGISTEENLINTSSGAIRKVGILKHAPSQPTLSLIARKYTEIPLKKNSIPDLYRNYTSPNVSPRKNSAIHPVDSLREQNSISHAYPIPFSNYRHQSPQSSGGSGTATPRRSLATARATEKQILKRCPQSDLSYRVQRCFINNKEFGEQNVQQKKIKIHNNQGLNFQKFEHLNGANNSNESTPSHSEGIF